ncbi:MAG: O-antigen ligase family protein [Verrucomicrobiales bacterium]|nr:O-antigen ligase family protein [Verrucomicrobiales bacterium]
MTRGILMGLLLLAVLLAGTLGTETRLLLFWPCAIALGLAGLLTTLRGKIRVSSPPSDVCLAVALLAALYFSLRAAFSPVAAHGREDWVIVLAGFVAYLLTLTWGSAPRWRVAMVALVLGLAVANLALGGVHFQGDWAFHILPGFHRSFGEGRIGGFFNNPNHLGAFLSMAFFMALAGMCLGRMSATWRLVLGFLAMACVLGMGLTISRGAFVGLAAGLLVFAICSAWLLWHSHRHLLGRLSVGALILVVISGAVLWKVNEAYLRQRVSREDATEDVRFYFWEAASLQYEQQPWLGQGARMFYDGAVRYRQPGLAAWTGEAEFAHSEWVQVLADYGRLGLVLMALVLVVHLGNGWRFVSWSARHRFVKTGVLLTNRLALTVGAMSAVVSAAVQAAVEFQWHVGGLVVLMAVMLGILANPGLEGSAVPVRRLPGVRKMAKLALPVAGGVLLVAAWIWGRADYRANRAEVAELEGNLEEAIGWGDEALALDEAQPELQAAQGERLLSLLETSAEAEKRELWMRQAEQHFRRAGELNPFNYEYALALADVLQVEQDQEGALREIHRALTLAPLYEEPRLSLALFHHRQLRFDDAEKAYLWASRAEAANVAGTFNWWQGYEKMLETVRQMSQPGAAPVVAP